MHEMAPYLTFDKYIPTQWAPSKGGHEQKLSLYSADHPKYRKVLAVNYSPKSNNPLAFSHSNCPHGCNTVRILFNGIYSLYEKGIITSIVMTPLSWRNPIMNDHIMASLFTEMHAASFVMTVIFVSLEPRPEIIKLYQRNYSLSNNYLSRKFAR